MFVRASLLAIQCCAVFINCSCSKESAADTKEEKGVSGLEISVKQVERIGHRYHISFSIRNASNVDVSVQTYEGVPWIPLYQGDGLNWVSSQTVHHETSGDEYREPWQPLVSGSSTTGTTIIHVKQGSMPMRGALGWLRYGSPEDQLPAIYVEFLRRFTINTYDLQFRLNEIGFVEESYTPVFVPTELVQSEKDSDLVRETQDLLASLPEEFPDLESELWFQVLEAYANRDFEKVEAMDLNRAADDAHRFFFQYPGTTSEKYSGLVHKLTLLAMFVCEEVEFKD